jgi:hypothetical protein
MENSLVAHVPMGLLRETTTGGLPAVRNATTPAGRPARSRSDHGVGRGRDVGGAMRV